MPLICFYSWLILEESFVVVFGFALDVLTLNLLQQTQYE